MFQIENVIYVSFAAASYWMTEEAGSVGINVLTDRPPPRRFYVPLRSLNGDAECESGVVNNT